MPNLNFNCSQCGTELSIDDTYAGTDIHCPICGAGIQVPLTTGNTAKTTSYSQYTEAAQKQLEERQARDSKKGSFELTRSRMIVYSLLALGLLFAIFLNLREMILSVGSP